MGLAICAHRIILLHLAIRHRRGGAKTCVFQSAVATSHSPDYGPVTINVQDLCGGDCDRPLLFEFFWKSSGHHVLIGSFSASLGEILGKYPDTHEPSSVTLCESLDNEPERCVASLTTPSLDHSMCVWTSRDVWTSDHDGKDWPVYTLINQDRLAKKAAKGKLYEGEGEVLVHSAVFKRTTTTTIDLVGKRQAIQEHALQQAVDYVKGGCDIQLVLALDYTESNRDPWDPSSLHFSKSLFEKMCSEGPWICAACTYHHTVHRPRCEVCDTPKDKPPSHSMFNVYRSIVDALGSVLQDYTPNRKIPLYQFGGAIKDEALPLCKRFAGDQIVSSYCFPLSLNARDPAVLGLEGLLSTYDNSWEFMKLSDQTLVAPVLRIAADLIKSTTSSESNQTFYVLVIAVDGCADDVDHTKRLLSEVASLPMSVIVVGVGPANFGPLAAVLTDYQSFARFVRVDDLKPKNVSAEAFKANLVPACVSHVPLSLVAYMQKQSIKPHRSVD